MYGYRTYNDRIREMVKQRNQINKKLIMGLCDDFEFALRLTLQLCNNFYRSLFTILYYTLIVRKSNNLLIRENY